ncbi:MAG: sugar ABC transporter substrate-binding protein [Treponema sp.]|jgi:ABC-type sugar transport system substrate-binding protein|nr:sugar ABC transporter substrate-binding protein [Treponema sp.]
MKKKTLVAGILILGLCFSTFANGSKKDEKATKQIKLAYVSMNLANPWNVAVKKGFETACKELGVQYLSIDSQYKVDKQVSDLENLINDNYSGFTFTPIDPNATRKLVEIAKSKGIATASIAQAQDNVNLVYTLKEYDYGTAIGTQAGNWIRSNLNGLAKVAIISQDNVEAVIPRGNGVQDAILKLCPKVDIVSRQAGDTPELGMKIIESVLQQHPDLDVVVATNDSGGIGGYRAMVSMGKTAKNNAVFSGDATAEALACIKEPNSIYKGTVDLYPYKGGYESAKILYKYVTEGIPEKQEVIYLPYVQVPQKDVLDGTYKPQN